MAQKDQQQGTFEAILVKVLPGLAFKFIQKFVHRNVVVSSCFLGFTKYLVEDNAKRNQPDYIVG